MKENQILIYKTEAGQYTVDVLLDGDTVWLTQKQMAKLFDVEPITYYYLSFKKYFQK